MPILDESGHKLAGVFTDYTFKLETQCGLKSCRRPHKWGYWIVTEGGVETILGNKCGGKFFPEFASKKNEYHERRDREDLIARFHELQAVLPKAEAAVRDFMIHSKFGYDWVRKCRAGLEDAIGGERFRVLGFHQRRGAVQVDIERERSDTEVDQAWELSGRRGSKEHFRIESRIAGFLAPSQWTYYNFKEELVKGVMDKFSGFHDRDPLLLSNPALRRLVRPLSGWDKKLQEAQSMSDMCREFFSDQNLELLSVWVRETSARRRLHDWKVRSRDKLLGAA